MHQKVSKIKQVEIGHIWFTKSINVHNCLSTGTPERGGTPENRNSGKTGNAGKQKTPAFQQERRKKGALFPDLTKRGKF